MTPRDAADRLLDLWAEAAPPGYDPMSSVSSEEFRKALGVLLDAAQPQDSFDAAWAEAAAAVPEEWRPRFTIQRGDDAAPLSRTWHATVDDIDDEREGRIGSGPTSAAALRALAAGLREL